MTRFALPGGGVVYIKWDEGDPVDWTTPDTDDGISHSYCGNCGLDLPGCGCPRDQDYDAIAAAQLPVQAREDPPLSSPAVTAEAEFLLDGDAP